NSQANPASLPASKEKHIIFFHETPPALVVKCAGGMDCVPDCPRLCGQGRLRSFDRSRGDWVGKCDPGIFSEGHHFSTSCGNAGDLLADHQCAHAEVRRGVRPGISGANIWSSIFRSDCVEPCEYGLEMDRGDRKRKPQISATIE